MKSLKKFLSVSILTVPVLLCCFAFTLNAEAKTKNIKFTGTKGKNKAEVAALKKLLKEHSKKPKKTVTDLNNEIYRWDKNGRLIGFGKINSEYDYVKGYKGSCAPLLKGTVSFSAFPELKTLVVGGYITGLDVSGNTKLKELSCSWNGLSKLDLSSNTELTKLYCHRNELTSLDLCNNTKLKELQCGWNCLEKLDLSSNTELTELYCNWNWFTELDLSKNENLTYLECFLNRNLTKLDLSRNTKLTGLDCSVGSLKELNLSGITGLESLNCSGNNLSTLDLSSNINLDWVDCHDNNLTTLDISKNTNMTILYCSENNLTTLDVSNCPRLVYMPDYDVEIIGGAPAYDD